jgi:hypothetical protein
MSRTPNLANDERDGLMARETKRNEVTLTAEGVEIVAAVGASANVDAASPSSVSRQPLADLGAGPERDLGLSPQAPRTSR